MLHLLSCLLAAGTALTNTTAETVMASCDLPANSFSADKVYDIDSVVLGKG
jgi:hypothetical protein